MIVFRLIFEGTQKWENAVKTSVEDPDPNPDPDPRVFGPP